MNPGARARPGPRRGLRGHLPGVAAAVGAERQRSLEAEQTKEGQEGGGEPAGRHDEGPGVGPGPGPGAGPGHATRDPARVAATAHTKPARSGAEAGAGEERSGGRGGEKAAGRGGRTAPGGLGWGCPFLGLGVPSLGLGVPPLQVPRHSPLGRRRGVGGCEGVILAAGQRAECGKGAERA